jgi:hypothetical protein
VLHVTTRSTGGPATDAAAVLQLLAEGQLIAARRLIDVLAPGMPAASLPPDIAEALTAVAKQEKAFAALRKAGAAAHAAGDIETAAEKFHQAAQIALDDDQLSAVISSLPPGRPTDVVVSASPDGAGIRVFWKAGLGADGQTRYSVVRKVGSAPGDTRDGTVLMPETAETSHVDASPPVAVPLFYGIAATRGGTPSPLATGTTMLVPPVTRVQSASRPTSVTISWQTPRGASGVVVTETGPNGRRDVPVLSQGSATSANLVTGTTYTFDVVAHYAGPDGTTCASAAVRVSAIPRSEADPVKMLDVTAAASPTGQPEAQASWRPIAGYVIEIWYFPAAPRCGYGQRIPYAELESEGGIQLVGRTTATSNRATVTGSVPAGLSHYLAITRDAAEAVVGQTAMLGVCQPVENPKTERFADEVVVSWDWPEQESEVRAIWQGPGLSGERRIRRAEYQEQGGLRIRVGAGTSTIRLVTVVAVQGANWTSPERVVSVAGPSGTLRYQVVWPKRLFGRAKSLTIVFSSDDALDGLTMIIAAKSGRYLPVQSDGCVSLDRVVLALVNGTQTVQVPLPASLGDPYWVRCFAASGHSVMLKEPDHTSLRGH